MNRILVAMAIAAGLIASAATADAGSRHKRHHAYRMWTAPVAAPQVGPIWSGPNQCWTDEGYGRYAPCNGRR